MSRGLTKRNNSAPPPSTRQSNTDDDTSLPTLNHVLSPSKQAAITIPRKCRHHPIETLSSSAAADERDLLPVLNDSPAVGLVATGRNVVPKLQHLPAHHALAHAKRVGTATQTVSHEFMLSAVRKKKDEASLPVRRGYIETVGDAVMGFSQSCNTNVSRFIAWTCK